MPLKTFKIGKNIFSLSELLTNKKRLKDCALSSFSSFKEIKIAIMAGSTVNEIKDELEILLLSYGIKPLFYISAYGKFYEESLFISDNLLNFKPDIVFIHTSWRNLLDLPTPSFNKQDFAKTLDFNFQRFKSIWDNLVSKFDCKIIQNDFDYAPYRVLGNMDSYDYRGINALINAMNQFFYKEANENNHLLINDLAYTQSQYGINQFSEPKYWHLYKYAMSVKYIPFFVYNLANIIKAIYGKNKKVLNIDLDNTLWGGVIGDDGQSGIVLSNGNPNGEAFLELHKYLKALKESGVVLTINSKNEKNNAELGLSHPESILKSDDFALIVANWNSKNDNLIYTAKALNLGTDSFVFVDDNPTERELIGASMPEVSTINFDDPIDCLLNLSDSGYFETVAISEEDLKRNKMYADNAKRNELRESFGNYEDFLESLKMESEIKPFDDLYLDRITQLINKTNQFNTTTIRLSREEIDCYSKNKDNICLYAKLADKFGDNGIVSALIGKKVNNKTMEIILWVMSCRVFSRTLESFILNEFVYLAKKQGIEKVIIDYKPSQKNGIIIELFSKIGLNLENNSFKIDINKFQKLKSPIKKLQ